ncbi:acyl-CoA thioesterase II [Erythrobacter sp. GH3-10]|uniref:Acyl-CoA thioesterase II n=2 Tax=Aurantiacibacter rhizosphaerae TaxID=2691582 RepID=A0A844XAG7_9SPHN|nr:acyl-CoA thioesterase II [Aurantiacibacter rhizosphaerae]
MLTLKPVGEGSWIGEPGSGVGKRLFGGHALAQALMAACEAEGSGKLPHSLHANFLAPGMAADPVRYDVTQLGAGRSFSRYRVDAVQGDRQVLTMTVSAQLEEGGLSHADTAPDVGDLASARHALERWQESQGDIERLPVIGDLGLRPIEIIPADAPSLFGDAPHPPSSAVWMRSRDEIGDVPGMSRAQLAYASDILFLRNALLPHGVRPGDSRVQISSLDHAIWFHTTPDFSQWHLLAGHSPWAGNARGLSKGHFFAEDGTLVATVMQENLMRVVDA